MQQINREYTQMRIIGTRRLITYAGGPTAFARYLGMLSNPNYRQIVNGWRNRGLPELIQLKHRAKLAVLDRRMLLADTSGKPLTLREQIAQNRA